MNSELDSLKTAGRRLREIEDDLLAEANVLARAKERLVFDPREYRKRAPILPAAMVFTAAAAAVLLLLPFLGPNDLTVQMDGKTIDAGAWISSPSHKASTLSFSDGSTVRMKASSGMRLRDLTPDGAHLALERGALEAGVTHRAHTSWKLDAGPYVITVVGTRFHVSWNPETEDFGLEMLEGTVKVEGPLVSARTVQAGETLLASLSDGSVRISIRNPAEAAEPSEAKATDVPAVNASTASDTAAMTADTPSNEVPAPSESNVEEPSPALKPARASTLSVTSWRPLADSGQFIEAVHAAGKVGIRRIFKEAGAADISALGDAARHAGDYSLAADAYKAVRRRFPRSTHASGAAFALGLMAFDARKDYADAARWFRAALKDRRHGPLSREASGRLMEALRLSGDSAAAVEAAHRYLADYPNGPHAALARRLTQ